MGARRDATGARVKRSKSFIVCFEAHRKDGKVWAVKYGRHWHEFKGVTIRVPVVTVYLGESARQPKAYLKGEGVLTVVGVNYAELHYAT